MGQQYNKVQKRRRRLSYLARKNEAAKAARKPGRATKAKPAARKTDAPAETATAA
jgi:hypothetical protein